MSLAITLRFTPLHFLWSSPSSVLYAYNLLRSPTNSVICSVDSFLNFPITLLLVPLYNS